MYINFIKNKLIIIWLNNLFLIKYYICEKLSSRSVSKKLFHIKEKQSSIEVGMNRLSYI